MGYRSLTGSLSYYFLSCYSGFVLLESTEWLWEKEEEKDTTVTSVRILTLLIT